MIERAFTIEYKIHSLQFYKFNELSGIAAQVNDMTSYADKHNNVILCKHTENVFGNIRT